MVDIIIKKGILACLDGVMNVVLEQIEEYENGELKSKFSEAFIRGNNGNYIDYIFQKHYKKCCT